MSRLCYGTVDPELTFVVSYPCRPDRMTRTWNPAYVRHNHLARRHLMLRLRRFQLEVASCCSEVRTMKIEPGTRFGRLTVIEEGPTRKKRSTSVCRCDCGTMCIKANNDLKSGSTRSCGCLLMDFNHGKRTHGMTRTRLYRIYIQMMRRCYSPAHDAYVWYGAKGVVVCEEWRGHPSEFIRWARANGYRDDLTIDRVAGGTSPYSPDNCR